MTDKQKEVLDIIVRELKNGHLESEEFYTLIEYFMEKGTDVRYVPQVVPAPYPVTFPVTAPGYFPIGPHFQRYEITCKTE